MKPTPFKLSYKYSKGIILKVIESVPVNISASILMDMNNAITEKGPLESEPSLFAGYNEIVFKTLQDDSGMMDYLSTEHPKGNQATIGFYRYKVQMAYMPKSPLYYLFQYNFVNSNRIQNNTLIIQHQPYLWIRATPIQIIQYRQVVEPLFQPQ